MPTVRFTRWEVTDALSLSALLSDDAPVCGIYVLEFTDGTEYVGQTINLPNRLQAHRRRWPNEISALRFTATGRETLDTLERDIIALLLAQNHRLRNVDLVALPLRSKALDEVVEPGLQADWLAGYDDRIDIGARGLQARQRRTAMKRYRQLAFRPDYDDIVAALATYIGACLPLPHQTEARFWAVTSLPSTNRSSMSRRLAAITVNHVEVLVLIEMREEEKLWLPAGFMNIAVETPIPKKFTGWAHAGSYRTTGPVTRLEFEAFNEVALCLKNKAILQGARTTAMGLLRKGPGWFSRYHDYNLADDVFAALEEQLATAR